MQILGAPSPVIHADILPVISQQTCRVSLGHSSVTERMFCTFKYGHGPCVGDTGSPGVVGDTVIGEPNELHITAFQ